MGSSRRSWGRRVAALVLVGAASVPLLPTESPACSRQGPELLAVRSADEAVEGEAPGAVTGTSITVTRGTGPADAGCGRESSSSCDDLGVIVLGFRPAQDPDSASDEVGYVVELVDGVLPEGLSLGAAPVLASGDDPSITLVWIDGDTDEQEPIDFAVTIHAIDVDGHEGPRSAPIAIVDAGR